MQQVGEDIVARWLSTNVKLLSTDSRIYSTDDPFDRILNLTQSRIIGAVRGAHSQLLGTIIPVCSLYAARKYDRRFGTPAIVWFTGWN